MKIKESLYNGKIIKHITIDASKESSSRNIFTFDNEMHITIHNDGNASYVSLISVIKMPILNMMDLKFVSGKVTLKFISQKKQLNLINMKGQNVL